MQPSPTTTAKTRAPESLLTVCCDRAPLVGLAAVCLACCVLGDSDLIGFLSTALVAAAGLLGLSRGAERKTGAGAAKAAAGKKGLRAEGPTGRSAGRPEAAPGAPALGPSRARRPGAGAGLGAAPAGLGGAAESDEERLKAAMRSLRHDAAPTVASYAAAMEVCTKRDLAQVAVGIFDLMLERGVGQDQPLIDRRVSVPFFKIVVHNLGDERLRQDGLRLLDLVRAHGLSPAVGAQDYLIVAWRSKLPKHVVEYFVKMREEGVVLSWTAVRCVMSFYQWSDPAFTLVLYGELTERGVRPDRVHFNAALTAYCELGKMDQAMQLLQDGPSLQVEPNAQTYQIVIRSLTSRGSDEEALALFEAMREHQITPYRATNQDAVLCYVRRKRYADAAALCSGMAPGSQRPGEDACSFLRRSCQRYAWTDIAAHVPEDPQQARRWSPARA